MRAPLAQHRVRLVSAQSLVRRQQERRQQRAAISYGEAVDEEMRPASFARKGARLGLDPGECVEKVLGRLVLSVVWPGDLIEAEAMPGAEIRLVQLGSDADDV